MPASTGPLRCRSFGAPGTLYESVVAERAHGISIQPLQAAACVGLSGASEAPKSTVLAVMSAIPVPEPTEAYVRLYPKAEPIGAIHCWTSGFTRLEPAP